MIDGDIQCSIELQDLWLAVLVILLEALGHFNVDPLISQVMHGERHK